MASDGGVTLHFAERVRSAAAPRHVVVTGTVDLIVGSGITFEDQGEHEHQRVPGAWRLFAVSNSNPSDVDVDEPCDAQGTASGALTS